MKRNTLLFSLLLIIFGACKREIIPADDVELGKEYYPLATGKTIEYEIDSIIYNDFNKSIDSFKAEFKIVIGDTFYDNQGRLSYLVNRYRRQDSTFSWEIANASYVTKTNFNIEVIENNLRFIKLVFPVKLKTLWDGNVYIPSDESEYNWYRYWTYKYTAINEAFNNGINTYDNSLTVDVFLPKENSDSTSYLTSPTLQDNYTHSREVYGKNIGLVYKELTNWSYQPSTIKWRKGFTFIMRAKKYY